MLNREAYKELREFAQQVLDENHLQFELRPTAPETKAYLFIALEFSAYPITDNSEQVSIQLIKGGKAIYLSGEGDLDNLEERKHLIQHRITTFARMNGIM